MLIVTVKSTMYLWRRILSCSLFKFLFRSFFPKNQAFSVIIAEILKNPKIVMLNSESEKAVPGWLEQLLATTFFSNCRLHGDGARSECNMYCLDCPLASAFCFYCRSSQHQEHRVIQIRRSSYHDVVRVSEIEKVLEISGVQSYVINGARVSFLNQRPHPHQKTAKLGAAHLCEICGRSLLDPFRFCSLGCKLVGVKRNGNASFALERRANALATSSSTTTTPTSTVNARRRKGIPHRAPL